LKILFFSHDGKLGDAVVNTAFLRGARLLDPAVELHVLASGNSGNFWQDDPRITRVWHFENPPLMECLRTSWAIRRERFDYLVTFKQSFRSEKTRILLKLAAPRHGVLMEEGKLPGQVTHAVRKSQVSLQAIYGRRAEELEPRYELHRTQTTFLSADRAGLAAHQELIVVNLFGSEPNNARTVSPAAAVAILQRLAVTLPDATVALSCTDSTQALAQQAIDGARAQPDTGIHWCARVVNTEGDLPGLVALCERASVVISPDTSLIHIASALDKPVVGIYQNDGVKSIEWAPLCSHFAVVISPDPKTIHGFSADEVVQKTLALRQMAASSVTHKTPA
jgi:ADP-heptose:LPS heptosyltransferase